MGKVEKCKWIFRKTEYAARPSMHSWSTECGHIFLTWEKNATDEFNFCPHCGKKIEVQGA